MFQRVAVGDIMTRNFSSVTSKSSLHDAAKKIVRERVDSMLIAEGKKLIGILTARDILWAVIKKSRIDLKEVKAIDIATKKVAVIKPSADFLEALNKMKSYGFRRLPVLSRGKLVGIVTLKDILRINPSLYHELGELAEIREEASKLKKISQLDTDDRTMDGICEECDSFALLLKVDGRNLCPNCRDELY